MSYRPDIDGLRAVAVGLVLAFHLDLPFFTGGFIGVDVFFVISGFLLSSHILRDLDAGTFSLADFYARRIRRIVPALLVMLLVVSAVGSVYLLPAELENLGDSIWAAALSVSNFYFLGQSGYFDAPAHLKPLLHTLGVWPSVTGGVGRTMFAVAVSLLLATASWRYVEVPFRYRTRPPRHASVFRAAAVATASVFVVGWTLAATRGFA